MTNRITAGLFVFLPLVHGVVAASTDEGELASPDHPVEVVIDYYIDARLAQDGVTPAAQVSDEAMIRRLTLDLAGRVPSVAEAKRYVESSEEHKKVQLVDRLLSGPDFVDQQVDFLNTMLMQGVQGNLAPYLEAAVGENRPWDRMFREMITGCDLDQSEWKSYEQLPEDKRKNPPRSLALEFVKSRVRDLDRLTIDASIAFFGVNISCAQCHDHPLVDDWKQDHFYGMKSFFSRTFRSGDFIGEREYGNVEYKTAKGEARNARLMFLSGTVVEEPEVAEPSKEEQKKFSNRLKELAKKKLPPPPPSYSRRARLAELALQNSENYFFSRSIVNRLWDRFFGHGLVTPLDQMYADNEASHPELMRWLARDMVWSGYDLTRLIRGIVLSKAYCRASKWEGEDRPEPSHYAVAQVRPLTPFQMARSLRVCTTDPEHFASGDEAELAKRHHDAARSGHWAINEFEQPQGDFQVGVAEALKFTNNERFVREYLSGGGRLVSRLMQQPSDESAVELAFWSVLSRKPTAPEARLIADYLAERNDRQEQAYQQVVWSLLSGPEFRFNH